MNPREVKVIYDAAPGSLLRDGGAARSPIGATITIPMKAEYFRNNYRCLADLDPKSSAAAAVKIMLLVIVSAVEHALRPHVPKPDKNPKKRRQNEEGDAVVDEPEPVPAAEVNKNQGLVISCEDLCQQYPHHKDQLRQYFAQNVPRILCQVEYVPREASDSRLYENLSGVLFSFTILDSTLTWERVLKNFFMKNAASQAKRKRPASRGDYSDATIIRQFDCYSEFVLHLMNAFEYGAPSGAPLEDLLSHSLALMTLQHPPEYLHAGHIPDGFFLDPAMSKTLFDVYPHLIKQDVFKRVAMPWFKERSLRDEILYGEKLTKDQKKFRKFNARFNVMSDADKGITNGNVVRILDPFNKLRAETAIIHRSKHFFKNCQPHVPAFSDDGNMDWAQTPEYKTRHASYIEVQSDHFMQNVWFSTNPNIPPACATVFDYIETCKNEESTPYQWNPHHSFNDEHKLSLFGEFIVLTQHFDEMNGAPEAAMTKMLDIFLSALSVYFLNALYSKALHLVIMGPPSCGKSWALKRIKKVLIDRSTSDSGSSSAYTREHGNGEFRSIKLKEETSAADRVDANSRVDMAQTNNRLTGASAHDTTRTIKNENGDEERVTQTLTTEVTEANIWVANEGFGDRLLRFNSNVSETVHAYITRFNFLKFSNASLEGRLSTASKALRASITKDTNALAMTQQFWQLIQSMCIFYMAGSASGVVPDIPLDLSMSVIAVITEKLKLVSFEPREIEDITLKIIIMQFVFAVTYYCCFANNRRLTHTFFTVADLREIMKLAIGRPEITCFVISEPIYQKTKQQSRIAIRNYAGMHKIYRDATKFFDNSDYGDYTPEFVNYLGIEENYRFAQDAVTSQFALTLANKTFTPSYVEFHFTKDEKKNTVSTAHTKPLTVVSHNSFFAEDNLFDKRIQLDANDKLTFFAYNTTGTDMIDINYVRVLPFRMYTLELPKGDPNFKLEAEGEDVTRLQFAAMLRQLHRTTFACAWLPPITAASKLVGHSDYILSMHLASGLNKLYCNMPILLDTPTGTYMLVKWLESNPKYLITSVLNQTFYHRTPSCRTVLSTAGDPWISYQTYRMAPVPNAKLTVPPLSLFNPNSREWLQGQSRVNMKESCEDMVFQHYDITEYFAKRYYAQHFPEASPDALWRKYCDDHLNLEFDGFRTSRNTAYYPTCLVKTPAPAPQEPLRTSEGNLPDMNDTNYLVSMRASAARMRK